MLQMYALYPAPSYPAPLPRQNFPSDSDLSMPVSLDFRWWIVAALSSKVCQGMTRPKLFRASPLSPATQRTHSPFLKKVFVRNPELEHGEQSRMLRTPPHHPLLPHLPLLIRHAHPVIPQLPRIGRVLDPTAIARAKGQRDGRVRADGDVVRVGPMIRVSGYAAAALLLLLLVRILALDLGLATDKAFLIAQRGAAAFGVVVVVVVFLGVGVGLVRAIAGSSGGFVGDFHGVGPELVEVLGVVDAAEGDPVEHLHFGPEGEQDFPPLGALFELDVAEPEASESGAMAFDHADDFVGVESPGLNAKGAKMVPAYVVEYDFQA